MPKDYRLKYLIDSTSAEAAAKRVNKLLADGERKAMRLAASLGLAYDKAASSADHAAQKIQAANARISASAANSARRAGVAHETAARQQVKAAEVGAAAQNRAADRQAKAAETAAQRQARTAQRTAKIEEQHAARKAAQSDREFSTFEKTLARDLKGQDQRIAASKQATDANNRRADQARAREERDAAAMQRAADRGALAKEKAAERARKAADREAAATLRTERRKQAEIERADAAAERAADRRSARRQQAIERGAMAATAVALVGVKALSDSYEKIRDDAMAAAEATLLLRKNLRVEATLKGADRPDNQRVQEALAFRAQTGLGEAEASDFTRQYLGTVPIARQKHNITPAVEKELMLQAGTMAARQGGDAGTRGELAGILGQFGKVESAEQGLGQLEAIRQALTEGRGDDTPLTQQLLKSAGAIVREGGVVRSLPEMAALIGATSLTAGPEAAGTHAEHIVRGFQAGLTRHHKTKGAVESQSDYLKRLGVKEGGTLEDYLDVVIPDLKKAMAAGRNPGTYLGEHGIRSDEERRALIETVDNYEVIKQRFAAARKAGQGKAVAEENAKFLQAPEGRNAVAEALLSAAQTTRGVQEERYNVLLKEAEASPEFQAQERSVFTQPKDIALGLASGALSNPAKYGRTVRLEEQAYKILSKRASDAEITEPDLRAITRKEMNGGEDQIPRVFNAIERKIGERGGSVATNIQPTMDRLAKAMEENNKLLAENNRKMNAPPAAGAPRQAPPPLPRP